MVVLVVVRRRHGTRVALVVRKRPDLFYYFVVIPCGGGGAVDYRNIAKCSKFPAKLGTCALQRGGTWHQLHGPTVPLACRVPCRP